MHRAPSVSRAGSAPTRPRPPLRSEHKNRPGEWVTPKRFAHQGGKPIRTFAEIDRLGGYQHLHSRRNRNHIAAFTARSTSRSQSRSTPGPARSTTPAISIAIELGPAGRAAGPAAHANDLEFQHRSQLSIFDAIGDRNLFLPWFRHRESWTAWFSFLCALFALPMTPDQFEIYSRCTGRTVPPSGPHKEAWLVCGRRAGKSFILALVAVFLSCFQYWQAYLDAGVRGTVMVIECDRQASRTMLL